MLPENKLSKMLIIALVFLITTISNFGQTEVQIPASMDNTIYEDANGNLSNGAGDYIFVGRTNQNQNSIRRGLINFDIAGNVPQNAVIQSVTLTLNMSKTSSSAQDISLHKVLAAWGEGTSNADSQEGQGDSASASDATWLYRIYDSDLWTSPGGDYSSASSASLSVDANGSYTWGSTEQMVADVQSWVDNPSESYGWILIGNENSAKTSKRFDSREFGTESNRPMLTVNYTMSQQTAMIDRFSMNAGHLFVRDENNGLPGPNEPIDFDQAPFMTKGLGPNGELISYYNFDVQSTEPAPIYVLFREGESMPVEGQMNIINVVPGDSGYNDFWEVQKVTVPSNYEANSAKSFQDVWDAGYPIEETTMLVNCPVVPEGSTAKYRLNNNDIGLHEGWYKGMSVYYFNFSEKKLMTDGNDMVPLSPIYVTFNINPDQEGGGPPSGFVHEEKTNRAHNVVATLPMDESYSPLWKVNVYDNADFWNVHDLMSAQSANILANGVANVNCPIVETTVNVDRFSMNAGHLFVRDSMNLLPGPNEPIDFDQGPFMTKGLGPNGEYVSYYNFDVQPTEPAPIYVFVKAGESPVPLMGQKNIIDVVPGDSGYNDFWEVQLVTVPPGYEANSIRSYQEIIDSGYQITETKMLVNCPVVPEGSTAKYRLNNSDTGLHEGWYKGMSVYYLNFSEKQLMTDENDMVPLSPIYVTFNINPDQEGGGPPSGFVEEELSGRTHNVVASLPMDDDYSPLWRVNVYDNQEFWFVLDLPSAQSANILANGVADVNCPIFSLDSTTVSVANEESGIPAKYELSQNYPNPFNPSTEIRFSIINNEKVTLKIYNSIGQEVAELVNNVLPAGNYTANWNAQNVASGVYFYSLKTDHFNSVHKMILLK